MPEDTTACLQGLIDRARQGDPGARRQLLERACGRLHRLAAKILSGSFPALRSHHEVESVVSETWLRLVQALDSVTPPSVVDFFRLAALKVRQVLLDLAERQRKLQVREVLWEGETVLPEQPPAGALTHDPARLALWTELHERVASLPEQERLVFEMHYYLDVPQVEIARLLELTPRKVSYLWMAATERLAELLHGGPELG